MGKQTQKNIIAVIGVICSVAGLIFSIPLILQSRYVLGSLFAVVLIVGIILLAIAFGD